MNEIIEISRIHPYYGYRRITILLKDKGYIINSKKVRRLMLLGGIKVIYPVPKTSLSNKADYKHPYLLKGLPILEANQVWSTDITYIKMSRGFVYLHAIIDVYSRYIVGWKLSVSLEAQASIDMLKESLSNGFIPKIINSDQGCQFTSEQWINTLKESGIQISMDGKGRFLDNIYIERFWRSLKQEKVYITPFETVKEARLQIGNYIEFYNNERPHQSLNYKVPAELYN